MIICKCSTCGSEDVSQDALYYPNTDETFTLEGATCNACGDETTLVWVDVPDDVIAPPGQKIFCTNCDD